MKLKSLILLLTVALSFVLIGCGGSSGSSTEPNNTISYENGEFGDGRLELLTQYYKDKYNLPALATFSIKLDGQSEFATVGKKKIEEDNLVGINNKWSIGSVTKSMTATIASMMIEEGLLSWDDKLRDIFPEFIGTMQNRYLDITLIELLSHSSGIPTEDDDFWEDFTNSSLPLKEERYELTKEILEYENDEPQNQFMYSNLNYIIASSILEKVSNKSFEQLIEQYLFIPLSMNNSTINPFNQYDDIWGHKYINNQWQSFNPTIETGDNAAIVTPAGSRTFVSLEDMGKYLIFHLKGMLGINELISNENISKLYTPVINAQGSSKYALGWFVQDENVIFHSGSNDRWLSLALIDKQTLTVHFVVSNSYSENTQKGVFEMMDVLTARSK